MNRKHISNHRWLLAVAATMSMLWLGMGSASALPQAITITPTSASPSIQAGSTYKGTFQVINQGSTSYDYTVYSTPYRVNGEDYAPDFTVLPSTPKVSSWFTFSQTSGSIKPGQTATINYSITVPAGTLSGGYYAAAFAQTSQPQSTGSITLSERVGELFYIKVPGPFVQKGNLLTWQSSFLQKQPLTSTVRLQDTGNIHYPATIHLTVKDVLGHTKYDLQTTKELLPQTIRKATMPWQGTPAIGLFKVGGTVSFLGQTHTLSTRWVLVLSSSARLVIAVFVAVIAGATVGSYAYRRHLKRYPLHKRR